MRARFTLALVSQSEASRLINVECAPMAARVASIGSRLAATPPPMVRGWLPSPACPPFPFLIGKIKLFSVIFIEIMLPKSLTYLPRLCLARLFRFQRLIQRETL